MGGGDNAPMGSNLSVNEFGGRATESIVDGGAAVIDGAKRASISSAITISSKVASFRGDGAVSNAVSGASGGVEYSESSFTEVDHGETVTPGTPVVIERDGEEITAIAKQHDSSGGFEVIHDDGSVEKLTPGTDGGRVTRVGDPSQMSNREYTQYMKDRFSLETSLDNVSERDYEMIVETVEDTFFDGFQSRDVAETFSEGLTNVTVAEKDVVAHAISGGFDNQSMIRFGESYTDTEAIHEATHALHGTHGYRRRPDMGNTVTPGKKTVKEIANANKNQIPDFGGEVEFGETAPSFDSFLLEHDSGSVAGAADAHAERAVANADRDELVVDRGQGAEELMEEVGNGDVVEFTDSSGETRVGIVTRKSTVTDSVITDDGIEDRDFDEVVVKDLYADENETVTSHTISYDGVAGEVSGGNARVDDTGVRVNGVVDKRETAREVGVDIDGLEERDTVPDDVPEEMHNLVAEVNKQWARTAGLKESGRGLTADMMKVRSKYSTTAPDETMAVAFESAFGGSQVERKNGDVAQRVDNGDVVLSNPDLAEAIDDVVALPDEKKAILESGKLSDVNDL